MYPTRCYGGEEASCGYKVVVVVVAMGMVWVGVVMEEVEVWVGWRRWRCGACSDGKEEAGGSQEGSQAGREPCLVEEEVVVEVVNVEVEVVVDSLGEVDDWHL